MERIQLTEATSHFKEAYINRYSIKEVFPAGKEIICCVDTLKSISCIPVYYYGYKVRVLEVEKMRDFL